MGKANIRRLKAFEMWTWRRIEKFSWKEHKCWRRLEKQEH